MYVVDTLFQSAFFRYSLKNKTISLCLVAIRFFILFVQHIHSKQSLLPNKQVNENST